MRAFALLLVLAAPAAAGPPEDERAASLVRQLGASDPALRHHAARGLRALGEPVLPLLEAWEAGDPETARALRMLLRPHRRLRLVLEPPTTPYRPGTQLVLDAALVNDSDDDYAVAYVRTLAGRGTLTAILLEIDGEVLTDVRPDAVEVRGDPRAIASGERVRMRITLEPGQVPPLEEGPRTLRALYQGRIWRVRGDRSGAREIHATGVLATPPVTLDVSLRSPTELAAALEGGTAAGRQSAVQELGARSDAAVLDLLRRHVRDPDVRLVAIRRLGSAARPEDFGRIREAVDDDDREVRLAAVQALGGYATERALPALIAAALDPPLRAAAVAALRRHRHAATIDCFVRLLRQQAGEPWAREIVDALYEWTGLIVTATPEQIDAFERWWLTNRDRWIRENPGDLPAAPAIHPDR